MSAILNAAAPNTASYRSDQLSWTESKGILHVKVKSQLYNPTSTYFGHGYSC